jgi:hypothetical protein
VARSVFEETCEALFGDTLGYGRRWKTAAAQALGIGRATLYRYFGGDVVPANIIAKLGQLRDGGRPVRDRAMVTLFARGLLDLQEQIDRHGWIKEGYPRVLQRAFDLAATRNVLDMAGGWPTDLGRLTEVAAKPLFEWIGDLSWDPEGEFTASVLLEDGEITPACIDLALPGRDPEAELVERSGYKLLRSICASRRDGQALYAAFRRSVVAHPVLSSWTATILTEPVLASAERIDEVVEAFYEPVPEAMTFGGQLPTCVVSGVPLRKHQAGWHTLSRDPDAIRRARAGEFTPVKWRPGTLQLRRAFRLYWCLPGEAELELAARLIAGGWTCELWPGLDRVDLVAISPDGSRRIAADVKDHISPENLAARFAGFKEYAADHECFLVVPDYMPVIARGYERRFETVRTAHGKPPVAVRTLSAFLHELGVRA